MFKETRRWLLLGLITGLTLLFTACGGNNPINSGSLAVTINGLPGSVNAQVTVSGPGGYGRLLTASETLQDLTPGSYTVSPSDVTNGGDTYHATVSGSPASVVPEGTVTASVNYALQPPDPDPPNPDPDTPAIDTVSIQGYGTSTQVRQGAGIITLEVLGMNLQDITIAKLGDLNGTVAANNPISAVIAFDIPQAIALGPVSLSLTSAEGITSLDAAVLVTGITAGPSGNDATGRGTPDSPFRSLTHTVNQAAAGNTITLQDGTYTEANGETWPVDLENLTLVGESQAATVLEGPGAGASAALNLRGMSSVVNLTVTDFQVGLRAVSGTVTLENISSQGNAFDGLLTISSGGTLEALTVSSSSFSNNARDGIRAQFGVDNLTLNITSSALNANGEQGFFAGGSAQIAMSDTSLNGNGGRGIVLVSSAELSLTQSTVNNNALDGILASTTSELYLNEVTVRSNFGNGIDRAGSGRLELRNSQVINNVDNGVRIRNSPIVNLGDAHEPGNNFIGVVGAFLPLGDFLADDRQANSVPKVLAFGTQLGDLDPPPVGSHNGPGASNTPYWRISNIGNEIDFGP